MKIHLYGIFWNEERMFPFFLHHYLPLCERIVLFDNGFTDNTKLLAQEHEKVEIRPWNPDCGHICDAAARHLSQVWRESIGVADWVIIADVDEFLYHQDLLGYLEQLDDIVDVVPLMGYDMINLVEAAKEYSEAFFIAAVGDPALKRKFNTTAISSGLTPCPGILSKQVVWGCMNSLGNNSIVCPNSTITTRVSIGYGCVVNVNYRYPKG